MVFKIADRRNIQMLGLMAIALVCLPIGLMVVLPDSHEPVLQFNTLDSTRLDVTTDQNVPYIGTSPFIAEQWQQDGVASWNYRTSLSATGYMKTLVDNEVVGESEPLSLLKDIPNSPTSQQGGIWRDTTAYLGQIKLGGLLSQSSIINYDSIPSDATTLQVMTGNGQPLQIYVFGYDPVGTSWRIAEPTFNAGAFDTVEVYSVVVKNINSENKTCQIVLTSGSRNGEVHTTDICNIFITSASESTLRSANVSFYKNEIMYENPEYYDVLYGTNVQVKHSYYLNTSGYGAGDIVQADMVARQATNQVFNGETLHVRIGNTELVASYQSTNISGKWTVEGKEINTVWLYISFKYEQGQWSVYCQAVNPSNGLNMYNLLLIAEPTLIKTVSGTTSTEIEVWMS